MIMTSTCFALRADVLKQAPGRYTLSAGRGLKPISLLLQEPL